MFYESHISCKDTVIYALSSGIYDNHLYHVEFHSMSNGYLKVLTRLLILVLIYLLLFDH